MRAKGATNNVRIKLSELVNRLKGYPDIPVSVSKSWVASTEETLAVKLTGDAAVEAEVDADEQAATGNRAKVQVD